MRFKLILLPIVEPRPCCLLVAEQFHLSVNVLGIAPIFLIFPWQGMKMKLDFSKNKIGI